MSIRVMASVSRLRLLYVALSAAVAIAGCGPPNERGDIGDAIDSAVFEAGDGGTIDMRDVVTLDWDTMYAFDGYTTDDQIRKAVGPSWPAGSDTMIPYDGWVLVVFVEAQQVAGWSVLNRERDAFGVFFYQTQVAIGRDDATFLVEAGGLLAPGIDLHP